MVQQLRVKCMSRSPLALSAAGGSFLTLALQLLKGDLLQEFSPVTTATEPLLCDCPLPWFPPIHHFRLDWPSVCFGILLGFFLGPIIDSLVLLRHLLGGYLRRQVLNLFRPSTLYRVVWCPPPNLGLPNSVLKSSSGSVWIGSQNLNVVWPCWKLKKKVQLLIWSVISPRVSCPLRRLIVPPVPVPLIIWRNKFAQKFSFRSDRGLRLVWKVVGGVYRAEKDCQRETLATWSSVDLVVRCTIPLVCLNDSVIWCPKWSLTDIQEIPFSLDCQHWTTQGL